jgi:hypothetical protein
MPAQSPKKIEKNAIFGHPHTWRLTDGSDTAESVSNMTTLQAQAQWQLAQKISTRVHGSHAQRCSI